VDAVGNLHVAEIFDEYAVLRRERMITSTASIPPRDPSKGPTVRFGRIDPSQVAQDVDLTGAQRGVRVP